MNILQVIGIHKLADYSRRLNCGTFIGEIFREDLNNNNNIIKIQDDKKNEGLNREKEKINFSEEQKKILNNEKPNFIEIYENHDKKNEGLNREKEKINFSEDQKKILNNEKPNFVAIYENHEMNKKDKLRLKSLYYNEIELKKIIARKDNTFMAEEYYIISVDWIEEFKKVFHYNDIIALYTSKVGGQIKLKNLPKIVISKKDIKRLKILKNTKIMNKFDIKGTNLNFYQSFCLISPK